MTSFKRFKLPSLIALLGAFLCGSVGLTQVEQPTVRLTTEPPIQELRAFNAPSTAPQSPAQLTLQVLDASGQPLTNANLNLQIFTPPKSPWLSTDFPIVEGTKLLELDAPAPTGEFQLQQMLPIRGEYELLVEVTPTVADAFTPFQQTLTLPVHENAVKYRNFALLAIALFAAGVGGGYIIGGPQKIQPGEIAPQRVRLLLSGAALVAIAALIAVNLTELSHGSSHGHDHAQGEHDFSESSSVVLSQGLQLQWMGDLTATVGQPAKMAVSIKDVETDQPITDVLLNVQTTALEDGLTTLAYQGVPSSSGQLIWQQQFFDGAPHLVQVEAVPQLGSSRQFEPLKVKQAIEVEAIAPPLNVRLITLFYFTGFLLVGIGVGLCVRRPCRLIPLR